MNNFKRRWRRLSRERAKLGLLLAAFSLLGGLYLVATPIFEASDELWHYPMVERLADGAGLPVQDPANPGPWRQEGSQPPLYYALMALATGWIDTGDLDTLRWLNPHVDNGIITPDGNNNIALHTTRENWPWRGSVLAVRLVRLLSVLLATGTVYFAYRLGLEAAPGRPDLALAAAGLAAFTPMFLFISASVNNDTLATFLSTAALWQLAAWLRQPPLRLGFAHLRLGLILGAAALSKVSALGLLPLTSVSLVAAAFLSVPGGDLRVGGARRWRALTTVLVRAVSAGVAVMLPAALLSFWWYWRNFQLYGDWLGWSAFLDLVGRRPNPASLAQLWGERAGFVQSYWGLFGGVSVPMPDWSYTILNLSAILAVVGLLWGVVAVVRGRQTTASSVAIYALLLAWPSLVLVGLVRWTSVTWASQGRLIFPAIGALCFLFALGLAHLWRGLPALVVGLMAALAVYMPLAVIGPHYTAPAELMAQQISAISQRVNTDFGGEMLLLGYDLDTATVRPGDSVRLTLYWQSLAAMDRNWSVFVHLIDDAGIIIAQRDRYPAQGALATTLLRPGQSFADTFVIQIPDTVFAPTAVQVEVGLYDLADGVRLPVDAGGDALRLGQLDLAQRPAVLAPEGGEVPNPIRKNFAHLIELVGYDMDRRTLRPGDTLRLTLYWRGLNPIAANYSVFARIRGDGEAIFARQDNWPQQGTSATSTWSPQRVVEDSYALTLGLDTPAGTYDVEVGLYEAVTGQRLQLTDEQGNLIDADYLSLSRVRVLP